jgi:hypothetical protein
VRVPRNCGARLWLGTYATAEVRAVPAAPSPPLWWPYPTPTRLLAQCAAARAQAVARRTVPTPSRARPPSSPSSRSPASPAPRGQVELVVGGTQLAPEGARAGSLSWGRRSKCVEKRERERVRICGSRFHGHAKCIPHLGVPLDNVFDRQKVL